MKFVYVFLTGILLLGTQAEAQKVFGTRNGKISFIFPRADFKGNIVNLKDVNFTKDGSYKVTVKGDLTMHGVTKNLTANGTIEIKGGKPVASCKFVILMKDFNVNASSITEKVNVEVNCTFQ